MVCAGTLLRISCTDEKMRTWHNGTAVGCSPASPRFDSWRALMSEMRELQEKIKEFCQKHNLESPPEHRVLDTMSELGEVAKEILKMSDYGRKPLLYKEELKSEIGDMTSSPP